MIFNDEKSYFRLVYPKDLIRFVCLSLLGLCFACEPKMQMAFEDSEAIPTSAETTGKLVALIDNNLSSYYIYKGQPRGFEYELLKWFCKDHDLKLEVKIIPTFDYILDSLVAGAGDLAAANFTVTRSRLERVRFSPYILKTRMVLVQRMPENHLMLGRAALREQLITDGLELDGKRVHVHQESVFYTRLKNYAEENGLQIELIPADPELETDLLIRMVSEGIIDYTVVDENVGRLQAQLFPNLHIETPLSLTQAIGWAVRKDSDSLHQMVSDWVLANRNERKFRAIYQKYFYPSRSTIADMQSSFNLGQSGGISPFDDLIKKYAEKIQVDWRLVAALIYHESRFMPDVVSPFGASGLMQVVPNTAQRFGVSEEEIFDPEKNISAGTGFLKYLYAYWRKKLKNQEDIDKFVLASYNVGLGHVIDARSLADKYGFDSDIWDDNVELMLLRKSSPDYFNDSVVKHGYCRGHEPVMYVSRVMEYFQHYRRATDE
jgi:membrane-bound lytic murein transglycosylase F